MLLIVDESSQRERLHLLRVSLAYRGGAVPLAWALWPQQQTLAPGRYWPAMDDVLDQARSVVPADRPVVVLADRAYAIPPFLDRLRARLVVRDSRQTGQRRPLWRPPAPGPAAAARGEPGSGAARTAVEGAGALFKRAGWRTVSVVACWTPGDAERLVVLTDQPPRWTVLADYGRRFWCESGFRNDKSRGWQWAQCQVRGVAHHTRLLLAMAWATLLVLSCGVLAAQETLVRLGQRRPRAPGRSGQPQHARSSLFTLGLRWLRRWLYHPSDGGLPLHLPHLAAPAWTVRRREGEVLGEGQENAETAGPI